MRVDEGSYKSCVVCDRCWLFRSRAARSARCADHAAGAGSRRPRQQQSDPDSRVDALQPDFNARRAADDAADAGAQVGVPRDAPVHAPARTGRLRRPAASTSSGSTPARRLASSFATACCPARRSASTGRAIERSRSSASTTCCSRSRTAVRSASTSSRRSRGRTTCAIRSPRRSACWCRGRSRRSRPLYAEPMFVVNSNPADGRRQQHGDDRAGTRLRIRPATYLVGEITPRLGGYDPGVAQVSFGIEMRAGGHTFQINVSNGLSTTLGQLASGGISSDDLDTSASTFHESSSDHEPHARAFHRITRRPRPAGRVRRLAHFPERCHGRRSRRRRRRHQWGDDHDHRRAAYRRPL